MSKLYSFLPWLVIEFMASHALYAGPMEIIQEVIVAVSHDRTHIDEIIAPAIVQLAQMPKAEVANSLYESLKLQQTEWRQWPTIYQIVEELPDFDIDAWVSLLEKEDDPFITNYAIKMAADNKAADSKRFIDFLHLSLSDKRVGGHLSGEARAYAKEGLRICDSVLNILWHREPEATRPQGYPFGVSNSSPEKRDSLITDYAKKFNVAIAKTQSKVEASSKILNGKESAVALKRKAEAEGVSTLGNERLKSILWLVVTLAIAAMGGVAWLLFRKRK